MASPNTKILLIVDYHAAIGGQDPSAPVAYAPVRLCVCVRMCQQVSRNVLDELL